MTPEDWLNVKCSEDCVLIWKITGTVFWTRLGPDLGLNLHRMHSLHTGVSRKGHLKKKPRE